MKAELNGRLKKLSLEQWKAHLRQDHQPYYRGCKTCLEACGQSRHHRRVVTPDSYTLAIDLAGPFKKGQDQLGSGRYMLVGSFTVPISSDGRALHLKSEDQNPAHRCDNPRAEGGRTASAASGSDSCGEPRGEVSRSASDPGRVEGGIFDDCVDPEEDPTEEAAEDPLMEEEDHAAAATKDVKVRVGHDCFIRALLADVENLAGDLIEVEEVVQAQESQALEAVAGDQEVFLQTRSYALSEVKANLADWKESMWSEFQSLTEETGAVRVITEAQADQLRRDAEKKGILFERIPGKAIFSRKAGSGKRKCRACACGNYMSQRSLTDTYAGGTGATEVRCLLKKCALEQWSAVTLDVKTAFLRAPRDHSREIVVVQPPQIFVLAGIADPGTLWLVDRALYGLTTSPKEWTQFRNEKVVGFEWDTNGNHYAVKKTGDQDIWRIVQTKGCAAGCGSPGQEGVRSAAAPGVDAGCGSPRGEGVRSAAAPRTVGYFVTMWTMSWQLERRRHSKVFANELNGSGTLGSLTAEAELMAMLEGLTAVRCFKSIVDMLQEEVLGGGWNDQAAVGRAPQEICGGSQSDGREHEVIQVSALRVKGGDGPIVRRLTDSLGLMAIASALMMTPVEATENIIPDDEDSGIGLILTILVISVLIVGDLVTRFGLPKLRSWLWSRDELKVKLLSESAVLPTRGTTGSAGLDLSASEDYRIGSGEYLLVKTGIAVELPRGTYGRLASRSSMACMGVEVSAGVIDRDFRGEIKVLIHNQSGRDFWVRRGDRIAQLIVERMMEVEIQQVESLTETSRGRMGFGSTGIESSGPAQAVGAIRSLRVDTPTYSGGSSATRSEEEGQGDRRRVSAEELLSRWPPLPPNIPSEETLVHRCRAPEEEQGDGTASTNQIPHEPRGSGVLGERKAQRKRGGSSATTAPRSSTTNLFSGPPANLGLCPIGAPMPGSWFQESAALNDRAKHFRVQVTDIVREVQSRVVAGCPGLIKWSLMRPSEWVSESGESLQELAERSGFAKFWPLHMPELWELLEKDIPSPERDRWCEVQLNSSTVMMVRLHSQLRRKLYDFKNDVMDPQWNYGEIQLTIAKLLNGTFSIIGGHRSGNGGPFLDDRWTGLTIFIKIKRA
eukprot:s781_g17.t1